MTGNRLFKFFLRFILTVLLGIFATAFNLHAANFTNHPPSFFWVGLDVINGLFALFTAAITIVYIYYQIEKIRKEMKK